MSASHALLEHATPAEVDTAIDVVRPTGTGEWLGRVGSGRETGVSITSGTVAGGTHRTW